MAALRWLRLMMHTWRTRNMSVQIDDTHGLEHLGLPATTRVHWNLGVPQLYETAISRGEATLAAEGPLVARTGQHTGRAPNDKFIVDEASSHANVDWGANRPMEEATFELLYRDLIAYLADRTAFALDAFAGADPQYRMPIRVVTELAWHNLFARNMFITAGESAPVGDHRPEFTVIDVPSFKADPSRHGTRSDVFVVVHLARKLVLIGGTSYAGEIKKAIFTILNYSLPMQGVLSMHCSANIGANGDAALFFGLSGTGKTTLSSDPARRLIGDDEHGWSDRGVFNFEGGCYAKVINLSAEAEPQIYATTRRFGTVLENVVTDPGTRVLDLADGSLTENTRASYPLSFIKGAELLGVGGHPTNIVMLTADAYGVLPPIARLTPEGAMYHFLSGYTAKVAGTEKGVTEPRAAFSTCFGAPFLPLKPGVYATLLGQKIATHQARVWLVNTGWTGGPYGIGARFRIAHTRAMIAAALGGQLDGVKYMRHAIFNLDVPTTCPGVPDQVLDPRSTWTNAAQYDEQATRLARMFMANFKAFENDVTKAVVAAGPAI
jgi:phosphoenolpyruvate carboxykinase (ATP)